MLSFTFRLRENKTVHKVALQLSSKHLMTNEEREVFDSRLNHETAKTAAAKRSNNKPNK